MIYPDPIEIVTVHAEGEVGNVIVDGVPPPPGKTLWEQAQWIARDGTLRNIVLREPRAGVFAHVNLLVPPKHPDAAAGFIIMEPVHSPPMSGSNTICVATVLLATGRVAFKSPMTRFWIEAPAGLVEIRAHGDGDVAQSIEIAMPASFVFAEARKITVADIGTLTVDITFGGDSFVMVDAGEAGVSIVPEQAHCLAEKGAAIIAAANEQIGFSHPTLANWSHISFCQFTDPVTRQQHGLTGRSAVVIEPGKIDRSPTGTGCSARLALMHARGEIAVGEPYRGLSILGSRFDCRITDTASVAGIPAVLPSVRGRAWLTGTQTIVHDPTDPWPEGYRLSDTWPNLAAHPDT